LGAEGDYVQAEQVVQPKKTKKQPSTSNPERKCLNEGNVRQQPRTPPYQKKRQEWGGVWANGFLDLDQKKGERKRNGGERKLVNGKKKQSSSFATKKRGGGKSGSNMGPSGGESEKGERHPFRGTRKAKFKKKGQETCPLKKAPGGEPEGKKTRKKLTKDRRISEREQQTGRGKKKERKK